MNFNLPFTFVMKTCGTYLLTWLCIIVFAATNNFAFAALPRGNGNLEGVIKNDKGETIPGASIIVVGSKPLLGAATEANGHYKLIGIPEGTHTIQISYIGYKNSTAEIKITAGQTVTFNAKLEEENTMLNEVVVQSGPRKTDKLGITTRAAMIAEMKNSPLVITGISGEQISRSIVYDAGEAAKMLPGVTLLNNFVTIRGLNERYNLTFINGMIAPSTETDSKAFSFDLLPSNMLDRMVVHRSPSPDLPGDFCGGVIKIYTRNTAQQRSIQLSITGQYRPGSSYTMYNSYQGGKTDWLGIDDGTRALPEGLPGKNNIPEVVLASSPKQLEQNAEYGKLFSNNWNPQRKYVDLDKRIMFNYYDSWKLGRFKLNNLTSLSYTRSSTIENSVEDRQKIASSNFKNYNTSDVRSTRYGGMQLFDFVIDEKNHVEFRNIFNQLGRDEVSTKSAPGTNRVSGENYKDFKTYFYNFRSRGLYAGNLSGDHKLGKKDQQVIHWGVAYARTTENTPDQRYLEIGHVKDSINDYYEPTQEKTTSRAQSRTYIKAFENNQNGVLDYEKKFNIKSSFVPSIKVGGFFEKREREIDSRVFEFRSLKETLFYRISDGGADLSNIFSKDNFKSDGSGWTLKESKVYTNAYTASSDYYAGYAALNLPLLNQKLNIYTGVRLERTAQQISAKSDFGSSNDTITKKYQKDFVLPSINVTYNFSPRVMLRAAYGATINRPQLRELTSNIYYDFINSTELRGNPNLINGEIENYDIRMEWYPTTSDFIAVGTFYKKMKNIIEEYYGDPGEVSDNATWENTPNAVAYGIEIEARKKLDFLDIPIIRDISIISNLALVKTETEKWYKYRTSEPTIISETYEKRPIQGSAPYVVNVSLYYDNLRYGTKVSANYNVFGRRLRRVGDTDQTAGLYESQRHQLDLLIRQPIFKNRKIELTLGVQDLFNQAYKFYRDVDRNIWYTPEHRTKLGRSDFIQKEYKTGAYYTFGLIFTL